MLTEFENEALSHDSANDENYHVSHVLNRLIKVFESSIILIQNANCNYYLFSDNICITIDYVVGNIEFPNLFIEILELINHLYFEFLKEGYFLRGGIDIGWFLEGSDIAVGVPLVNAYQLESTVAIYPRIMLSENFQLKLKQYEASSLLNDRYLFLKGQLLKEENGLFYINPLIHIITLDDSESKLEFLKTFQMKIIFLIHSFLGNARVLAKYVWSANDFNDFINYYLSNHQIIDDSIDYSENELNTIKKLKIDLNGL